MPGGIKGTGTWGVEAVKAGANYSIGRVSLMISVKGWTSNKNEGICQVGLGNRCTWEVGEGVEGIWCGAGVRGGVWGRKTCPNSPKPSEKLVVVTPMNKDKRVRFAEPVPSSSNIPKQTNSLKTKDSNKPLLTSTGVKPTTSASGSKPSGNTKNNRISRPPSSNQKNKVEDHSRKVKSSLNKTNFVFEPVSKVFSEIGYSWKPTSRTFTIVRNRCPLTRITITPPDEAWTKYVSGGVTLLRISSTKHKERHLRLGLVSATYLDRDN
nr:hypothetical protein [Tanacetum cinerariifolium]